MFPIILIAFFSLIILMVIHELGHLIAAKRFGIRVDEFGIFFPPRLIAKRFGETLYSLNLLPFGAFVKIYGEEGEIDDIRSFSKKPIWQRSLIILAGVVSFWVVAVLLLSIVMGLGFPVAISDETNEGLKDPRVQITAIAKGSPAELAGIRLGDTIKEFSILNDPAFESLAGKQFSINKVKELQGLIEQYKGQEITLTVERGKEVLNLSLIPRIDPPQGEGAMGVALVRTAIKDYPWYLAPLEGLKRTFELTWAIINGLGQILGNFILGKGIPKGVELMGPVGIVSLVAQVSQLGIVYFLQFIALLSIYLAIFNILPIPTLDGGKLVFLGIEAIRKKPVSQKIEQNVTAFFFTLLVLLMIWVTIKDIISFF